MSSKASTKKKDATKNSYLSRGDIDDEVKAELEAMTGLEYNLHGEKENETGELFRTRKLRMHTSKESTKFNDKIIMETDKMPVTKEKTDIESSIPYLSSSVSIKELRNVIQQVGNTSEDRYKILEARDRLMRLRRGKIHNIETAKVTVGTCPDMCPEKERIMREFQRQVASYELYDSPEYKINHEIAVKQYSRSSADQEEPMPQDLRPVNSLKMTMNYLLHEIADLCEEEGTNLVEWYHFLWDRTRGIRKDITQQELCCIDTVELVERCARFHIVSSERLCTEELAVFDSKINTENLTKCLQTLKYMYNDLRINGISCKNEPEFRGYIILLNLNDANFMWDLQHLPSSIQKSPEVNFALRVYSAIQSNNYTKFFKLVKNTTYLNACILLRYFVQVRSQALSIMIKAYITRQTSAYPLYEFMDILAFDDENEAIYFCEQAGLNMSDDEMHIILTRQNIILPPPSFEQGRARSIVEAKRIAMGYSIGQAISGGKMPEQTYLNHKPHNSFDSNGYLKTEAINASDQSGNNDDIIEMDDEHEEQEEVEEQDPYEFMDEDVIDETTPPPPPPYVPTEATRRKSSISVSATDNDKVKENTDVSPPSILTTSIFSNYKNVSTMSQTVKFPFASTSDTTKVTELSTSTSNTNIIFSKRDNNNSTMTTLSSNQKTSTPFSIPPVYSQSNIFEQSKSTITIENNFENSSHNNTTTSERPNIFSQSTKTSPFTKLNDNGPFHQNTFNNNNLFTQKSQSMVLSTLKKDVSTVQVEKDVKKVEKKQYAIEKSAMDVAEEIETEVVHNVCSNIFKQEIQKDAVCDRLCNKIFNEVLEQVIENDCHSILEDEIMTQKKIHDISNRIKNRIIMKYYILWCQRVFMKKQQRRALDNTPVWLPKCTLSECANNLYSKEQKLVINNMRCKRKINNKSDDEYRNYLVPIEVQIYNGLKKNAKGLDIELSPIMYWKMLISWPNLTKRYLLARYKKMMCEYFSPRDFTMDPIVKTYKPNSYETLNICIQHVNSLIEENHAVGADGLFFITTVDENIKSVIRRLKKTILSRQKLMRIPLALVIFGDENDNKESKLIEEIQKFIDSGYIFEYIVYHESRLDESTILHLSQTAIDWLTCHKSSLLPLEMNCLNELINSSLTDDLWMRISGHASYNINLSIALNNPKFVIDLHNEAVAHLIDIVNDPESLMYTSFPSEFKQFLPTQSNLPCTYEYFDENWKTSENREKIKEIIQSFTLPPWKFDWPITNTLKLHKCIVEYCESILANPNYFSNISRNVFYHPDGKETPNFIHVILMISKERLRDIDYNLMVVYNKNHIKHFQTVPWWFGSDTLINFNTQDVLKLKTLDDYELYEEPAEKRRRLEKENKEIPRIIDKYNSYIDENNTENSLMEQSHYDDIFDISQKFERTLSKQLLSSSDFEQKLDSALREVDMNI